MSFFFFSLFLAGTFGFVNSTSFFTIFLNTTVNGEGFAVLESDDDDIDDEGDDEDDTNDDVTLEDDPGPTEVFTGFILDRVTFVFITFINDFDERLVFASFPLFESMFDDFDE